ncbi:MAG: sugar ABC transporter permease [Provencibacterium sp.]|jgi:putative aldouronate transport system permease protein|nr:sugar ABC transporter permease [Provencibacterium sp.]
MVMSQPKPKLSRGALLWVQIKKNRQVYFLLIFGIIWYAIFAYIPMYGLTLAFKKYRAVDGIFGSPWVGLDVFQYVFRDPAFFNSVVRTLWINAGRLIFQFPIPIVLSLLLNEVRLGKSKKVLQSVFTFPHFLSWIIVSSIMLNVLGHQGILNSFIKLFGGEPLSIVGNSRVFVPLLYITENWKSAGWTAIIYMASIAGIDQEQYEAAEIDGASRFQRMMHITLPGIQGTMTVLFILAAGNLMTAGFDQIYNLSNPATATVAETLDMYIYRVTFQSASDFSFSSAVSLFKSVINCFLLIAADRVSKRFGGSGLFG